MTTHPACCSDCAAPEHSTAAVRRDLTVGLAGWGAASVIAGLVVQRVGRSRGDDRWAGFGQQTWAWGAIDLTIAVVGEVRHRRGQSGRAAAPEPTTQRRTLRRVLAVNSVVDLGYVVGGAVRAGRVPTTAGHASPRASGQGSAVMVQGAALLVLDTVHLARLRRP